MSQIVWITSPPMERLADEALDNARDVYEAQQAEGGVAEIGVEEMRRRYYEGGGGFPAARFVDSAETIDIGDGRSVRVFRSPNPDGVYLMYHSGGWLSGGPDLQDERMAELAATTNTTVVCGAYRLSPESKHPDAVDDCEATALWVIENASGKLGSDRLIIGGESAGAHLAALTILRLRDKHDVIDRVAAANLIYGFFDLSLSPSARLAGDDGIVLTTDTMRFMIDAYLPDGVEPDDPTISPIYASLHDLVPARFVVGDLDPLLDDTLTMSARWRAAGNPAITEVYPNCVHAFDAMPIEMADLSRANEAEWIAGILASTSRMECGASPAL